MSITNYEERYIALRKKENRIYKDEEVIQLPEIAMQHPHYKEWMMRKASSKRLITWLKNKKQTLKILEVGCGNGWLSNQLSKIENTEVTGLDISSIELQQAESVFKNNRHLKFVYGEIRSGILKDYKFNIIVFAASIQYFQLLQEILNIALLSLDEFGEIHIIDSHFYTNTEVCHAKRRSIHYYAMLGFPEMADIYFHHCIEELRPYNFKILYKPSLIRNKLFRNRNPFPWICIKRN